MAQQKPPMYSHVMLAAARRMCSAHGSHASVAALIGKTATVFSHELAGFEANKLGLVVAYESEMATGRTEIVDAWAAGHGCVLTPLGANSGPDLTPFKAVVKLHHDCAAVADKFADACEDGVMTQNELVGVLTSCDVLLIEVRRLQSTAHAMHAKAPKLRLVGLKEKDYEHANLDGL
jgi:hypothetical protein